MQSVSFSIGALLLFIQALLAAGQKTSFKPLGVLTGSNSVIDKPSISLITDPGEWRIEWGRNRGGVVQVGANGQLQPTGETVDLPAVDFKKTLVIAVLGGQSANVAGYEVVDSGVRKDAAYVRLRAVPSPSGGIQLATLPYGFFLFPRPHRAIVVEAPGAVGPDGTVQWRQVARFADPDPKPTTNQ